VKKLDTLLHLGTLGGKDNHLERQSRVLEEVGVKDQFALFQSEIS
jgi:hypothetical protein